MVLQVYHTTPTTPAGAGFNTDITGSVRIHTKRGLTESADLGEVAGVEITVDDPNLSLSFVPRQAIALIETTAPSGDQRVFTGYIASTSIVRCDDRLCMLQGRIWILECAEFNALMGWRIVRGENSDRPQETAENRLLWLMSTTFLNGLEDLGLIDWTDPAFDKVLPPVDYEGQWGKDVLADISAQTGLGFYGYVDETLGNDAGLAMFDFNTFTDLASTLRLSNVSGDVDDATTFAIGMDSRWTADGERIAPGVYATGADGLTSYGYSPTTQYAYGNVVRDQAAPMPNVTTQTALDAARNWLLNQHTDPDETFKTRIVVPAAKVNAIRKGYSLPVKLSHVPNRSDFTDWRVVERAVSTPDNESQAVYDVDLDLVPMGAAGERLLVAAVVTWNVLGYPAPQDLSTNPWTVLFFSGDYVQTGPGAIPNQFPGPGDGGTLSLMWREIKANEPSTVATFKSGNYGAAWVFEVAGVDLASIALATSGEDIMGTGVYPDGIQGASSTISAAVGATDHVLLGAFSLQKVDYGGGTEITTTDGTELRNVNAANQSNIPRTVNDGVPPRVWIGYATGSGTLTIGGTIVHGGAGPGDYNFMSRAYAAIKIPIPAGATFSLVQQAFGGAGLGATFDVSLPSPPTAP